MRTWLKAINETPCTWILTNTSASARVNLQPLISRELPLRQAVEALALACAKTGIVKVQLDLN